MSQEEAVFNFFESLKKEVASIKILSQMQTELKNRVKSKNWQDFDDFLKEVKECSKSFEEIDSQRNNDWKNLCSVYNFDLNESFYTFVLRHDFENKIDMINLYKELKMEYNNLKVITSIISQQVDWSIDFLDTIVNEVKDSLDTGIYSQSGRVRQGRVTSSIFIDDDF